MSRILFIFLILLFLPSFYFYLPVKRAIVYRFNLSTDLSSSCCKVEDISPDGSFDENADTAIFDNKIIDYPKTSLAQDLYPYQANSLILGTTNSVGAEKWIEVSLKEQRLRAWEGDKIIMEFPISSGKWAATPKGDYQIWYKTRRQTMKGGSKELNTYYFLPNVPHNMFFYKGYAIHGAYWHNNFGNPMSHGCVNTPLSNAAEIFEWADPVVPPGKNVVKSSPENPGTRVFVH